MAAADNSLIQRPGLTTAEAPQQKLSKGDIAAPYDDLARNMTATGEGITEIATNLAGQAGRKAVRTDDSGNLVVDSAPIVGPASQAYYRAANMTALAKLEPEMQDKLTQFRIDNPNNPEGFKAAAKGYLDTMVGKYANNPALAGAVEKAGAEAASHNYRTSLIETNHNQVAESLQAYQARIKDINEQTSSLARQGGTDTPEYISASANRAALWSELQKDPRFKFSKERADLEVQEAYSKDVVQSVIGNVQRTFQDKRNLPAAQRALQDAFWGPGSEKLKLTASQRDHGITEGLHALANLSAQDREAVAENKRATTAYVNNLIKDPALWNEGEHNNLVHRAEEIGDYHSLAELQTAKSFVPLWDSLKRMPPTQAAATLETMSHGIVPGGPLGTQIDAEAKRVGLPPEMLRRYVQIESGGRANAVTGSYKGLLQLSDDEFRRNGGQGDIFDPAENLKAGANALKARSDAFRAKNGRAPTATELYLSHNQGEGGLAAHMANPDAPAWQNMASTAEGQQKGAAWARAAVWGNVPSDVRHQFPGGVESVTSRDFMNVWQRKVEGALVPGQQIDLSADNATARLFQSTVRDFRTRVGGVAEKMATGIETKVKNGDGLAPDELQGFVTAAVQSGKTELIDKVQPSLKALDVLQGLPEGASATAVEAQVKALKAAGVDDVQYQALGIVDQNIQQSAKDLREKPLIEGAKKQWFAPIGPLDPQNPQSFVGELQDREKKAGLVNQHDPGHGPVNLIAADEGNRVATALTQGDPQAASQILGAIGTLSPENSKATMFAEPIKKAVVGMSGSSDPARMTAAMTAMDQQWRRDPGAFKAAYGETAANRLQAWQALKDQFSSAEIAERINKAEDPATSEARRKIGEQADKELKADPQATANQLGGWWNRMVPFAGARPPSDNVQAQIMADQFSDTYKALRTYSVDPDQAKQLSVKRLQATWSQSSVAGGQFMQHAPESVANPQTGRPYYPAINGSQSWMSDQLASDLEKIYGRSTSVEAQAAGRAAYLKPSTVPKPGERTSDWRLRGLIPDSQTQGEISSGKPPTYQVVVDRAGQTELVHGADGRPLRYRWDYEAAKAAAMPAIEAGFQRARQLNEMLGPTGYSGPQP